MKKTNKLNMIFVITALYISQICFGQQSTYTPDLSAVNDSTTFDAIYFRPFNFFNPERNTHSVQYISMPDHPWQQLRQDFPGKYESKIYNPPNPDDWFHATIEIN